MPVFSLSDKIRFIESVFGQGHLGRNAKNMDVCCPICAPADPNKKKLSIRVDDDRTHCWVCGFKSRSLISLLVKFSTRDKLQEYKEKFCSEVALSSCRIHHVDIQQKVELPKDFRLLAEETRDPDTLAVKRYLMEKRGLSFDDFWRYKIGVSDEIRWHRRAIVPSFDRFGHLNYFVARAIDARRKPKYDNPDIDKLPIIFNEINVDWSSRLVICEGVFDMFKAGENVVPLLGSDLSEESALFNAILANSTPVALALDADMWYTKVMKHAKKLTAYNIDVKVVDTRSFNDPGDSKPGQFEEAITNAAQFDWTLMFSTKLESASQTKLRIK